MSQKTTKFITLGCKVNQYETQAMRESLTKAGWDLAPSHYDSPTSSIQYVVINTCSVTADADRESRYWVRRAKRDYPQAKIVVTGCGVSRDRKMFEAMGEVDLILHNEEKLQIVDRLMQGCGDASTNNPVIYSPLNISSTEGNGRAFVKIQDGCNHACSFCKVVMIRGRSRSRAVSDVIEEVVRLRDAGYREIVFAGIQLGAYGLDLPHEDYSSSLIEVLEKSAEIEGIERLRLSSIEPTDIRDSLIEAVAEIPKFCPHLHIPLQSGDDEVLKKMNRRYGHTFYRDLMAKLRKAIPNFSLTLDVMAGFPTETEAAFQSTYQLIQETRPLKCHVFPYSRREGTRAAQWTDLPKEVIRERVKELQKLSDELGRQERQQYLGQNVSVLVEEYQSKDLESKDVILQGLTPNYLKVQFEGAVDQVGQMVPVQLERLNGDLFWASSDSLKMSRS